MLCEKCKNKKPTVFFTDNGGVNHALCAACASAYTQPSQLSHENTAPEVTFIPKSNLTEVCGAPLRIVVPEGTKKICEYCKISYADIQKNNLFGCPVCAEDILNKSAHVRRMPESVRRRHNNIKELEELRSTLARYIADEDYENAARVRDKIRKIQSEE